MHKIRPTRILGGFTKAATAAIKGEDKEFVKQRKKYCFEPCEYNKGGRCTECGCVLLAKTQEDREYCPINKWEDIKILEGMGIAVRILNPEKAKLKQTSSTQLDLTYKEVITERTDTKLSVQFINDRANFDRDWETSLF